MFKSLKTIVLAIILVGTAIIAHAQKKITEGTLTYKLDYQLSEEQKPLAASLPTEIKVKFNNGFTKIAMEQGPAMINIINNNVDETGLILVDVPIAQKQFAVKQTKEQLEAYKAETSKYSNFKATGEKQTIAGFNAEKYTYTDGDNKTLELWATKDLDLPQVGSQSFFKGLGAFPVKYTIKQNGVLTTNTLKAISEDKVGKITIDIPAGYEVTTMEALMTMGRQ